MLPCEKTRRCAPPPGAAAGCLDPEVGRRVLEYELGELTVEEAMDFEAHLLACDPCFEELKTYAFAHDVFRVLLSVPRDLAPEEYS